MKAYHSKAQNVVKC